MPWSEHAQEEILDAVHNQDTVSFPATVYVALSSTAPDPDGSNFNEPSGSGYARVQVTQASALSRSDQTVANDGDLSFPESEGSWASGDPLTHFGVYDASTNGNLWWYGELGTPRTVDAAGITLTIPAGELTSRAEPEPEE